LQKIGIGRVLPANAKFLTKTLCPFPWLGESSVFAGVTRQKLILFNLLPSVALLFPAPTPRFTPATDMLCVTDAQIPSPGSYAGFHCFPSGLPNISRD
jgi:hypothetical protein